MRMPRPSALATFTALLVLTASAMHGHSRPLAAQVSSGQTNACVREADRLDRVLSESLASEEADLERVLADVQRTRQRFPELVAPCTASLAANEIVVLQILDRVREANSLSEIVRERYYGVMTPNERADFHLNWGYALTLLGQTQASTLEYVKAAALSDELDPSIASTVLLYAALTFNEVGDPSRAAAYLREADSTARANLETEGVQAALGEIELEHAILYQQEAQSSDAPASLHQKAIAAAQRALSLLTDDDFQSPEQAMSHLVIARSEMKLERYEQAEAAMQTARPLVEFAKSFTPYVEVERWMMEGELANARGLGRESREAYARAISAAREARLPTTAVQSLLALAEVVEQQGDNAQAEAHYREAIELGEAIRQRLGLQDWSLSASDKITAPSERLAALLARQGRAEEAFQVLDGSRARRLLDLRAQTAARESLPESARAELDGLLNDLDDVRLSIPGASGAERSALDADATRIQTEIAALSGFTVQSPAALDIGALRDTLEARQQTMVSYLVGRSESWAFVVRPDTLMAVLLPRASEAEIRARIEGIGVMWQDSGARGASGSGPMTVDPAFALPALEALYTQLVEPVAPLIGDASGLLVVPGTQLSTLPFGMLVKPSSEASTADYASADYLIRHMPVGTELAATLLTVPTGARRDGSNLIFGRSTFETRADLPFVRAEAKRVRRALSSPVLRLDADATESDLVSQLGTADIVHIASHADADPDFPLYSQISLTDDPNDPDDGTLHLYELQDEPLAARLVVLSGCSTARGRALRGEGMMGLQYAVRAAGAASALATLWPVDDRATVDIMGGFYDHLASGLSKDRALQQAQLDYLNANHGMDASPFYWAPAVLTGDPAPMPVAPNPWRGIWGALLGAAVLSAAVAWWLTHRRRVRV
ncbi:hypothetical protein BSZ36_15430 [Rubricoccus marinus]|uniref:CHAT domain-containing protein n=2 Tax=Rubricoccus marinus TaxID=716817 RepID=A0A259U2P6_9BACT|nr:hypothetical protein BSZ36_15430 [Rubricoccus marinus]